MSLWVRLLDAGPVDSHEDGGTYVMGGSDEPELNITYNYLGKIRAAGVDITEGGGIHGQRAGDTLPALQSAVAELGTERASDYWASTPGNCGYALSILARWAEQYPDGEWEVT